MSTPISPEKPVTPTEEPPTTEKTVSEEQTSQVPAAPTNGKPAAVTKSDAKDYTSELPMFDLEDSLSFVAEIQSKGLERGKMPDVAKAFGYESASSTSFYRKLVACRLFGLLAVNGAELTERARDYFAPTTDDSKQKALVEAIQGVSLFAEQLALHGGTR